MENCELSLRGRQTLLAQARLNEFTMQPGGSGETSGLTYDFQSFHS